ncbi:MAG TPA: 2-C-methyl-D-erythritol 2,4-cyclodiphosphate synthase [Acidimicrobiia bacterium]|nr:2-C-methyl-D-erythritol 2,4-cyclodiphosphate synthase [Acidimicrobiia bacterium]
MRVGWGVDAHRFAASGRVVLGGVVVDDTIGVEATSDGDVVAHAVADAMLGAAALGDIGDRYPSDDPRWRDADSMAMVVEIVAELHDRGFAVSAVDITVVAERIRVAPHRSRIRQSMATALGIAIERISVKATTTDGMGFAGRGEGLAAMVVAVLEEGAGH